MNGFSKIVVPLTKLLQKNVQFEWLYARQQAFREKKERCFDKCVDFDTTSVRERVYDISDVSYVGLGCMFMQDGRVIAYALKQLKNQEQNIFDP